MTVMLTRWTIAALAAASAFVFGPPAWRAIWAPETTDVTVDVDFGRATQTPSMSGLINGFGDNSSMRDQNITPLRLHVWRGGDTHIATARRLSVPIGQIILSNLWGYPGGLRRGNTTLPYGNWPAWEAMCRETALKYRSQSTVFEVWNEPDYAMFWTGSEDQFFETYVRAFKAIRSVRPDAQIGGPGLTKYNRDYIDRFLNASKRAGVEVNFLSWHELREEDQIPAVRDRLLEARTRWLSGPDYSALNIKTIFVNEFLGKNSDNHPGAIVGYFRALEDGRADGACKSCWPDADGNNTCFDNSLDGLLTHDGQHRKATWWTWKYYADAVANRVESSTSDEWVQALAGLNDDSAGNVLIGYFGVNRPGSSGRLSVHMRNLQQLGLTDGGTFQWTVTAMNAGANALDTPPIIGRGQGTESRGEATIPLDGFPLDGAVEVTVTPK